MRCEMRIALRNLDYMIYAVTDALPRDYLHWDKDAPTSVSVSHFASRMSACLPVAFDFSPVDAAPQFVSGDIRDIEDLRWFAAPLVRTEEIVVEPKTVEQMLEEIRKMQAPEQARIREKGRREDAVPRQVFHAQILSLAA